MSLDDRARRRRRVVVSRRRCARASSFRNRAPLGVPHSTDHDPKPATDRHRVRRARWRPLPRSTRGSTHARAATAARAVDRRTRAWERLLDAFRRRSRDDDHRADARVASRTARRTRLESSSGVASIAPARARGRRARSRRSIEARGRRGRRGRRRSWTFTSSASRTTRT